MPFMINVDTLGKYNTLVSAVVTLSPGKDRLQVFYQNDVGPNDDYFHEWWEVGKDIMDLGNISFNSSAKAHAYATLINDLKEALER